MDNNENTQLQQGCNLNLSQEFIYSYLDEVIAATRNGTVNWKVGLTMEGSEYRNCLFKGRLLLYRCAEASQALMYVTTTLPEEEAQRYTEHRNLSIDVNGVTVSGDFVVRTIQRIEEAHHICATRRDRRERLKRILNSDLMPVLALVGVIVLFVVVFVCLILPA